uniref:Late embryogenesis abundant protein LEA-2 subgroup domain-containing protein n=1 Tax=Leersia perrieri TaxID=77586 RepID=A0A0D9XBP1_9ORYZ
MLLECCCDRDRRICLFFIGTWILGSIVVALPFILLTPDDTILPAMVNGTTLFELNFDNATATVTYNFTVAFSFHNPNFLSMDFSGVAVTPQYAGGEKLGPETELPTFSLRHKQTAVIPIGIQGRQTLSGKVPAAVARTYTEESGKGYFTLETAVDVPGFHHWYDFVCTLHFPAPPMATSQGAPNLFDGDACIVIKDCRRTRYGYLCFG